MSDCNTPLTTPVRTSRRLASRKQQVANSSVSSHSKKRNILTTISPNKTKRRLDVVVEDGPEEIKKTSKVTPKQIHDTMIELFGNIGASDEATQLIEKPCISARIFACYALSLGVSKQSPLLKLFRSLVKAELLQLGSHEPRGKVHFSAYDGSGTHPPVDRDPDSAKHQTECIEAYDAVKHQVNSLTRSDEPKLTQFLEFLNTFNSTLCAQSLPRGFSEKRIDTLATLYRRDFDILVDRLRKLPHGATTPLSTRQALLNLSGESKEPLSFETTLASLIGQRIRYHLRMFFNVAPPRLSQVNEQYDRMAESTYSKVSSKVSLTLIHDEESVAVEDGCLSAMISSALRALYEFFGLEALLGFVEFETLVPETFCGSEPSLRKLPIRSQEFTLTEDDLHTILDDIQEATLFLAAVRGARFLIDLWSAPGVAQEIERMGGWSEIETYASMSWRYDLHRHCDEDAHLIALSNVDALVTVLKRFCKVAEGRTEACEGALSDIQKNYRLTTKAKNLLNRYPFINNIASVYEDSMKLPGSFPHVESIE